MHCFNLAPAPATIMLATPAVGKVFAKWTMPSSYDCSQCTYSADESPLHQAGTRTGTVALLEKHFEGLLPFITYTITVKACRDIVKCGPTRSETIKTLPIGKQSSLGTDY